MITRMWNAWKARGSVWRGIRAAVFVECFGVPKICDKRGLASAPGLAFTADVIHSRLTPCEDINNLWAHNFMKVLPQNYGYQSKMNFSTGFNIESNLDSMFAGYYLRLVIERPTCAGTEWCMSNLGMLIVRCKPSNVNRYCLLRTFWSIQTAIGGDTYWYRTTQSPLSSDIRMHFQAVWRHRIINCEQACILSCSVLTSQSHH